MRCVTSTIYVGPLFTTLLGEPSKDTGVDIFFTKHHCFLN